MHFLSVFRAPAADDLAEDEYDREVEAEQKRRQQLLESGELEADDANGITEIRWAPRRMRWTRTEPCTAGLYAVRVNDGPRHVVEVYKAGGVLMAIWTDIPAFRVAGCGFEFSDRPYPEIS